MKIQLSDRAKQSLSKQKHEDFFDFNTAKPQRPVRVKQNFFTPAADPKHFSPEDRALFWKPILKWLEQHRAELLDLGWSDQELKAMLRFELWKDAGSAFVDKKDCSLNVVCCDGSIKCHYPISKQV